MNRTEKHQPILDEKTIESMDTMHMMKSPDDLDPMDIDQAALSRLLDETGEEGLNNLAMNANATFQQVFLLVRRLPLNVWQRVAWEGHLLAQRPDASEAMKLYAHQLWLLVEFFQKLHLFTKEAIRGKTPAQLTGDSTDIQIEG